MTGKLKVFLFILVIVAIWKGFQYFSVFRNNTNVIKSELLDNQVPKAIITNIKVSIYYEALCSDSRNFIIKQLVPTYNDLHHFMQLDFIPYGKATTIEEHGKITFHCQHAATECLANKIHACGLHYISAPAMQLQYIACMINDNMLPHEIGEKCAQQIQIDYDAIRGCANGEEGSLLLKAYGIRTHNVNPSISFIPTIELDDTQKVPLVHILKNLHKELCNLYNPTPKQCL